MTRRYALLVLPALLAMLLLASRAATPQSASAPASTTAPQELASPVAPQSPSPAGSAELESLIEILEDPAQRDQLIATLRLLQESQAERPPSATALSEELVTGLIDEMSTRTEMVRRVSASILTSLDQIPHLFEWLQAQLRDPIQRSLWLSVGVRVAASIGFAAFAYLSVAMALRPVRRRLGEDVEDSTVARVFRLLLVFLIDLLPVLSFVLAILAVALFVSFAGIRPSAEARAVAQPLIQAVILARLSVALARLIFAPMDPKLRLLPIPDAAAIQAFRWTRALTGLTIYGYLALQAARALGLPWTIHGFLLHLLFFVVVLLVIMVIVRSRVAVARAIASLAEEPHGRIVRRLPWRGLAGVWHLLAAFCVALMFAVWALKIPGGFQLLFGATLGSALIGVGCWLALRLVDQLFGRERPIEEAAEAPLSAVDRRLDRYLPIIGGVLRAMVWLAAALMLLQVWGFGTLRWLLSDGGQILGGRLIVIGMIVVVTIVVWEVVSLAIERSITEQNDQGNLRLSNRTRTLLNIVRNFLLVFLSLIALFLILSELGLNVAPLLAGAGVIGLAIGFGSQKLVQDIITGMFVLLGDTMRIGDVVQVAARTGVVEQMTMRTVVLREYSGNVHTIPYSAIDTVTNFTKDFSYAVFDVGVAYRENVDQVMEVLREIGAEINRDPNFRRLILEPLEVAGVDRFAESAVIIRARLKTRPLKQWEVSREFNRRLKNRFDELGIEIPFPHQTVYFGVDKEGRAPPVKVALEGAPAAPDKPTAPGDQNADPQPLLARSRGG